MHLGGKQFSFGCSVGGKVGAETGVHQNVTGHEISIDRTKKKKRTNEREITTKVWRQTLTLAHDPGTVDEMNEWEEPCLVIRTHHCSDLVEHFRILFDRSQTREGDRSAKCR